VCITRRYSNLLPIIDKIEEIFLELFDELSNNEVDCNTFIEEKRILSDWEISTIGKYVVGDGSIRILSGLSIKKKYVFERTAYILQERRDRLMVILNRNISQSNNNDDKISMKYEFWGETDPNIPLLITNFLLAGNYPNMIQYNEPVTIDGVVYKNVKEAANILNISPRVLKARIEYKENDNEINRTENRILAECG
jgi:hypothetical protein